MKPAPFKYIAAATLEQALALKAEYGDDAKFLAGGQSLIPAMNFRLARPAVLIDINALQECAGIALHEDFGTRIGALTRYRTLQNDGSLVRAHPLFAEALPHIAHPQIRNRGTIGGNLSHADPASELPALVVAMEATIRIKASTHERKLAAADFFQGLLTTDLQPDEMLVEIELPVRKPRTGTCFMEVARRRGDFALAGAAAILTVDQDGICTQARLVLCGVGETPVDASDAAAILVGHRLNAENIIDIADAVMAMIEPAGNVHATPNYQRHIAGVLAQRTLRTAHDRAGHDI
jgi:CO/xanthine dehydrogenase FAD-binding subunit